MGKSKGGGSGSDRAKALNYGRKKNERDEDDQFDSIALALTQGVSVDDLMDDLELEIKSEEE